MRRSLFSNTAIHVYVGRWSGEVKRRDWQAAGDCDKSVKKNATECWLLFMKIKVALCCLLGKINLRNNIARSYNLDPYLVRFLTRHKKKTKKTWGVVTWHYPYNDFTCEALPKAPKGQCPAACENHGGLLRCAGIVSRRALIARWRLTPEVCYFLPLRIFILQPLQEALG